MSKRLFRALALLAGILLVPLLARPNPHSLVVGGILVFFGEVVRVWASGHLMRTQELTTSGPYAYLRDPLYLGRLLLLVGFCIMAWGYAWIVLIIGLGVFFLNYMPRKYHKEMTRLEDLYGDEYRQYAAYARSLLPRLKPYPGARPRNWSFDLFWKENREQYFLSGVVILALALVALYLYPVKTSLGF
jgi:protein-S-isoprenylcysteine O-methyltransferase Ste14